MPSIAIETMQLDPDRILLTDRCVAADYVRETNIMHRGVSGNDRIVTSVNILPFVPGFSPEGAFVRDRLTGDLIATLVAPPGGWKLPFKTLVSRARPGTIYVLDAGGFPAVGTLTTPILIEYSFSFTGGHFSSSLIRSMLLGNGGAPNPVGFVADMTELPNGDLLLPDQVGGQLYLVDKTTWNVQHALGPQLAGPENGVPQLVGGLSPTADTWFNGALRQPVHFGFAGGFLPGVNYVSSDETHVYFQSLNTQTFYKFPIASLYDARQPWQRVVDITVLWNIPAAANATEPAGAKIVGGHTRNPYSASDRKLYISWAPIGAVVTIDVDGPPTQQMEILVQDVVLFDCPVSIAMLPPKFHRSVLVVANDQEILLPGINGFLPPTAFPPFTQPFRISKVIF